MTSIEVHELVMKPKSFLKEKLAIFIILALSAGASTLVAQTTAFNFSGRLSNVGLPANTRHDMRFTIYGSAAGADLISGPITVSSVAVRNGIFSCRLDFGEQVFNGSPRWLEIAVRPTGTSTFTNLSPRVELTSTPYAVRAKEAAIAASVTNGAVVKSLNNLRDNVTLAAGANVTLATNGNILTIGSTAGGGGGWSTLSNNTYYTAGNVGIGTNRPTSKVEIVGVQDALKINGFQPVVTFQDSGAGNARSALQAVNGGLNLFSRDYLSNLNPFGFLHLDEDGRVGIGAANPGGPLEVASPNQSDILRLVGPNATISQFDNQAGYVETQIRNDAGDLRLRSGNTVAPALTLKNGSGNLEITGHARQERDKGGWVKAMAKVNADGTIAQQYSALGGNITCTVFPLGPGLYHVNFPFQVNDRFLTLTPLGTNSLSVHGVMCDVTFYPESPNLAEIRTRGYMPGSQSFDVVRNPFFVMVY